MKTDEKNVIVETVEMTAPVVEETVAECTEGCECACDKHRLALKTLFDFIDTNRIITIRFYKNNGSKREQVDVNFGDTFSSKFENLQKYGDWFVKTIIPVYISAKRQNAYLIIMEDQ